MSKEKAKFELFNRLQKLGFTYDEAVSLRRIEMTLSRWSELECGTGDERVTRSIERDETTGKPYLRVQYATQAGWTDRKWLIPDREKGALKRMQKIIQARNARAYVNGECVNPVTGYHQGDPRGCALYVVARSHYSESEFQEWRNANPGKNESCFPFPEINSVYYRGLAVCA